MTMLQRKYILGTVLVELDFFKGRRICYDKAQASSFGMTPIFALLKNHLQKILRFEGKKKHLTILLRLVKFTCSVLSDSATRWTAAHQASLSITNSWSLPKLMSIKSVIPSNRLLLSPSPAFNLSQHQCLFKLVSSLHQVAKVLEFQLQHQFFQ